MLLARLALRGDIVPLFVKGQPRPPASGRKKGTPNRATVKRRLEEAQEAEERAASIQSTEQPIDYMLRIMRDPASGEARRDAMARAAAPYCHPQLQAVAHKLLDAKGKPVAPIVNVNAPQMNFLTLRDQAPRAYDRTDRQASAKTRHEK
jgi:hypothetical protein